MKYLIVGVVKGFLIVIVGVLLFFWPRYLRYCLRSMSRAERESPIDESERIVSRIIGVCFILMGLAYTIAVVVEYLSV